MRHLLWLVGILLASASYATFDLVLVADEGTDTIHRFDGGTGVYLGAFTGPYVNPRALVIDQASSLLFVGADNGNFIIDLWSGTLLNAAGSQCGPGAAMVAPGQFLYAPPSTLNILYGAQAGISGAYNGLIMPSAAIRRGLDIQSNVLFTTSGSTISRYSYTGFGGTATLLTNQALTGAGTLGQTSVGAGYAATADGSTNKLHFTSANGAGSGVGYTYSSLSTLVGVDFAHNDIFYVAGRNAGNTSGLLLQSATGFTGTALRTYGSGILQNPTAVATITAPEPASLIGLGLGAILLRRRRRISH